MLKRILLIVEGDSDEVRFFRALFSCCYKKAEYQVVPYKANVHMLAQHLYNYYPKFEDDNVDIKLVLSSMTSNKDKKELLRQHYTDVYMVFDLDPHHDHPHFDTVVRMINYFNDSTYQGRLYINYPMMQSYKHFSSLPNESFVDKTISFEESKHYKRIVGEESHFTDLTKYDYVTFYSLAVHHIKKANYLLTGNYALPTMDEYLDFDYVNIFKTELDLISSKNMISILNTSIFVLPDYAPNNFFNYVTNPNSNLLI